MDFGKVQLGKAEAKQDARTFRLASFLKKKLTYPVAWDFDTKHPEIPLRMYRNDVLGDCVIAARANQTTRFELLETGKLIKISDSEVQKEYFKESGGADSGLIMLDSLNAWRKGWTAARKKYTIDAYAAINTRDWDEVCGTIYAKLGLNIGLNLPISAQAEIAAGKPWTKTSGKGSAAGSWGGHCVMVVGYTATTLTCLTWGQRQVMSKAFFQRYCDEAFGIVDSLDKLSKKIDRARIVQALDALK